MASAGGAGLLPIRCCPREFDSVTCLLAARLPTVAEYLVRRSQRAQVRWGRLFPILYRWIPQPRVLHPYPHVRFAATHPR